MLQTAFSRLSALIFTAQCQVCPDVVGQDGSHGVCEGCLSQVRAIQAPHCVSCGRSVTYEKIRCSDCQHERFHFDGANAYALYEGKTKELLQKFKFHGKKILARFWAEKLRDFARHYLESASFDAVLAVPMDTEKQRKRGFNQSLLLSNQLAKSLGLPDISSSLQRKAAKQAQAKLDKKHRRLNIIDCFEVTDSASLRDKNLLLIDDVLTTGQTASECAKTLKTAGAKSVRALVCARGQ